MAVYTFRNLSLSLELLKVCRSQWLTAREVGKALSLNEFSALQRMRACEADGFLVSRKRARTPSQRGNSPVEFKVAPAWGGDMFDAYEAARGGTIEPRLV